MHILELCRRANSKLSVLPRLANILPFKRTRLQMKSFFESQFSYCPLIWMLMSHKTNRKINRFQERSLRILYRDDSVTVHTRNIHLLATEMFKVYHGISPDIICDIFSKSKKTRWNLRNQKDFETPRINTVYWGSVSSRYLGPQFGILTRLI